MKPDPTLPGYTVFLPTGPRHGKGWHVKFRHEGKQIMRSLRTTDRAAAEREALELVRRTVHPREIWAPEMEQGGPRIADVVLVYLALPDPSAATRGQNVRDLCRIVQARFSCERPMAMGLPVAVLNARTLDHYVRERQGGRIRRDRVQACNLSVNSTINHAKGVFSARARARYLAAGMVLPSSLAEWLDYPALPEPKRGRAARKFQGADLEITVWVEDGAVRWSADRPAEVSGNGETEGAWT
jgi:hypothetical protein